MKLTPKQYWNLAIPAIQETGYLDTSFYYLLTYVPSLQAKIDEEDIKNYAKSSPEELWDEIQYVLSINTKYMSQTRDVSWLEALIEDTFFDIVYDRFDDYIEVEPNELYYDYTQEEK